MIDNGPRVSAPKEEWVRVTPQAAEAWLERNENNRTVVQNRVLQFAEDMEAGRWAEYHPHGISFDETGRLIDGQHRLHAVVVSGVPVTMRVTTGLPEQMHTVFDLGAPRTAGEILRRQGVRDPSHSAALATVLHWYNNNPDVNWGNARYPSKTQINEFVLEHEEDLFKSVSAAHVVYRSARLSRPAYGALHYLAHRQGFGEEWKAWHDGVATGAGLRKGDPRLSLRNYFLHASRLKEKRERWERQKHLAVMIKALSAHLQGREMHVVRFEQGNLPMPVIVGSRASLV